ncbi:MAG: hypothetical protein EOM05_00855 [Clostridia bacterium]|nr:hypothetical protein [Clostridia bacterium]
MNKRNKKVKDDNIKNEKISFKEEIFSEVIVKNPVLVSTIGLCPVVAICTSLKSAVALSIITYLTMIFSQIISASFLKYCPQWARVALYTLSGMVIVAPSMLLLEKVSPENMIALGIYLPLLAINPLITRQCERVAVKSTVKQAAINAVGCATGYAAVLLITGFLRELFGSGTLWGFRVFSFPTATALTNPFGGFIVIGFMAALLRWYFKKIDPEYAEELAVNSRSAIKKPRVRKPRNAHLESAQYEPQAVCSEDLIVQEPEFVQSANLEQVQQEIESQQNLEQTTHQPLEEQTIQENIPKENPEIQLEHQVEQVIQEPENLNKKIEYTSKELDELMARSLEDIIKDATQENPQDSEPDKEVPKQ